MPPSSTNRRKMTEMNDRGGGGGGGSIIRVHLKRSASGSDKVIRERQEEEEEEEVVVFEGDEGKGDGIGRQRHSRHNHHRKGVVLTSISKKKSSNLLLDDEGKITKSNNYISKRMMMKIPAATLLLVHNKGASWWSVEEVVDIARYHPIPCVFALSLLFFMGVEYTLLMVPSSSQPFDIGFLLTASLHSLLATRPALNSVLAALNTVFVGMQAAYILWTLLVEGRPRPTISALFMFTCRGILGYSTQLPLPQGFLGSGVDFPVGNVSFFLFFSGHVAGSVIASLDMRRMRRHKMAWAFEALNVLQCLRLLSTRGHYTIDLAVGVGAGFLFDVLAAHYQDWKQHQHQHQHQHVGAAQG